MDTTILPLTRPPSTLAQQVGALVARWLEPPSEVGTRAPNESAAWFRSVREEHSRIMRELSHSTALTGREAAFLRVIHHGLTACGY
jgi:hypothetical protein